MKPNNSSRNKRKNVTGACRLNNSNKNHNRVRFHFALVTMVTLTSSIRSCGRPRGSMWLLFSLLYQKRLTEGGGDAAKFDWIWMRFDFVESFTNFMVFYLFFVWLNWVFAARYVAKVTERSRV